MLKNIYKYKHGWRETEKKILHCTRLSVGEAELLIIDQWSDDVQGMKF